MKILFYTNLIFLTSTLFAYILIDNISGLTCQFFLGIIQLLYVLISRYKANTNSLKQHLKYYKVAVVSFCVLLGILVLLSQSTLNIPHGIRITIICVLPMSIATYFVYITYLIQKQ
ncbi:hypothetical protein [Psychroserpens algicola]|uniref:Uncharacterized protein n=1 Tax=Psychroserpens algicola TaxID=1719034 RepID=A0ABT0H6T9_9FLAO|nr:hypothetical protein [Psychroserpens algicola]MCK8480071.1 hypothetical protein [Psychroserpens algicola]